ncbi:MAG: lysophospholipid acyltransferase family protein [Prolixibacteraceae bacterium]|nr:lysophospholipid acyltransferase family protein [Prolixibacteraceae bacterium]
MKRSIGYYILMAVTWPMQLFKLEFHYFFSGILYFIIYNIVGYRRKVVFENLKNSFPEKSIEERKAIERNFYRGFADMFIETLYFTHINIEKQKKRLALENFEQVKEILSGGRNIVLISGHFGNWEFFQLFNKELPINKYFIYKKLGNKVFDQFYKDLRGRAAMPLEMKETYRRLATDKNEGQQFGVFCISDQRPLKSEINYWLRFMNQDTPVMLGTEKIARKTDSVVFYLEISKIKRGYHKLRFELMVENPGEAEEHKITKLFFEKLENSIRLSPEQYFWTHKRWKYKIEDFKIK